MLTATEDPHAEAIARYEEWKEAKKQEREESQGKRTACDVDSWDPSDVLDPPESTIQIGNHNLVFRELTYKQAKGLFGIINRIILKLTACNDFNAAFLGGASSFDNIAELIAQNIGIIAGIAGDEIIDFVSNIFDIEKEELEENIKCSQVIEIVNIILTQNKYEIQSVVNGLKKTKLIAEELNIFQTKTESTGETVLKT